MTEQQKDKEKLLAMSAVLNGAVDINWHEEGGGTVYKVWDMYILFEVPQFGGQPSYIGAYSENQLDELIKVVHSWT